MTRQYDEAERWKEKREGIAQPRNSHTLFICVSLFLTESGSVAGLPAPRDKRLVFCFIIIAIDIIVIVIVLVSELSDVATQDTTPVHSSSSC